MKRTLAVLMVAMLLVLVGCGGPQASITAKDYNTRLIGMMTSYDAKELADISTMVIGANKKDFDELTGWYADKDFMDRDILVNDTLLGGRLVAVELLLDGNRVSEVDYSFEDTGLDDVVEYVKYDVGVGENRSIRFGLREESTSVGTEEVENDDLMLDLFADAYSSGKGCAIYIDWDYTNQNGDEARIMYSYNYVTSAIGDMFFSSISFSLKK